MAIVNRRDKSIQSRVEAFTEGAPDGYKGREKSARKGVAMGNKTQISLTISPDLLDRVDDKAQELGMTRAAFITMALNQTLKSW
ncbi:hypothetical protein LMG33818_002641 [Halomonadaceae bacterium LMG 33818]|uniref:hypothetical protein n=1 Tax=Cernens ardua TaxID=3402176 RepID=UPI003EDCA16F